MRAVAALKWSGVSPMFQSTPSVHGGVDCGLACRAGMRQVKFHRVALAINVVLAGGMHMELQQCLVHAIDGHPALRAADCGRLQGVAIVDHVEVLRGVVDVQRMWAAVAGAPRNQVDRGLQLTGARRGELSPSAPGLPPPLP